MPCDDTFCVAVLLLAILWRCFFFVVAFLIPWSLEKNPPWVWLRQLQSRREKVMAVWLFFFISLVSGCWLAGFLVDYVKNDLSAFFLLLPSARRKMFVRGFALLCFALLETFLKLLHGNHFSGYFP